ncbi:MAG: transposase [Alphaproteobacteria bacterium]|nr:transposase [Alphaproteobacteria bacterium]
MQIECRIIFCAKYSGVVLYVNITGRHIEVIKEVYSTSYVNIVDENVSPDHVYMLL